MCLDRKWIERRARERQKMYRVEPKAETIIFHLGSLHFESPDEGRMIWWGEPREEPDRELVRALVRRQVERDVRGGSSGVGGSSHPPLGA